MALQQLRSSTANKRPTAGAMSDGQLAVNTNATNPGLFFKDADGSVRKVGPVFIGSAAPNASPASGGSTGHSVGEQWLDNSGGTYVLKIWDGTAWRSESGTFVDVNGDTMTGVLQFVSGSASAPGIAFSGDTNTGIFRPGADSVAVTTGGTQRITVDSSGRLGINSATPEERLHVNGAIVSTSTNSTSSVGGSNRAILDLTSGGARIGHFRGTTSAGSGYLGLFVDSSERLRIDSSGRLGLGTTSPKRHLHINGGNESVKIQLTNTTTGSANDGEGFQIGIAANGDAFLEQRENLPLIFYTNNTEAMRLDSSRRLLVGTTTPGDAAADNLTLHSSGDTGITIRASETDSSSIYFADGTGGTNVYTGAIIYDHATDHMSLHTNGGAERLRIGSNGNVSVGTTTTDQAKLHVENGSFSTIFKVSSAGAQTAYGIYQNSATGFGTTDGYFVGVGTDGTGYVWNYENLGLGFGTNNTERLRIDSSGSVGIGTTANGSNAKFEVKSTTGSISSATSRINAGATTTGAINTGASLLFAGHDGANERDFASLFAGKENGTSGNHNAYLAFATRVNSGSLTERMRIDSSGNIGIGTSSPGVPLDIAANNSTANLRITDNTNGARIKLVAASAQFDLYNTGGAGYIGTPTNSDILIATNNTERMRISSSGLVGIGASNNTSYDSAAQNLLIADESGNTGITIRSGGSTPFGSIHFADGISSPDEKRAGRIMYGHSGDFFAFITANSERLRITSDGKVGIGTSSPDRPLAVSNTSGDGTLARFVGPTNNLFIDNDRSGIIDIFSTGTGDSLAFGTQDTERMRIDSSGRLLVGVSSSFANANADNLQVGNNSAAVESGISLGSTIGSGIRFADAGDASAGIIEYFHTDNSLRLHTNAAERMRIGTGGMMQFFAATGWESSIFYNQNGASSTRAFILGRHSATAITGASGTDGTISFKVATNGDVTNTNDSYGQISDVKLKENIVDAPSQWNDFKAVRFRKYNFKEETGHETHTQLGVIAQELELTSPGLVYETPDVDGEGNDLGTTTKAVKSSILTKKALVALQEAMDRIETLEAKVAALEAG